MEAWNELIGFLIIILVFLFPMISALLKKKIEKKKIEPKETEELEVIEEEEESVQLTPPPRLKPTFSTTKRLIKSDYAFESEMSDHLLSSDITQRQLETQAAPEFKKKIVSQAFFVAPSTKKLRKKAMVNIARRRDPLQSMVIMSEIIKEPKSMQ